MAGVETRHPDYIRRASQWRLVRDCYEGEDTVKERGEDYVPKASGMDTKRYRAYMKRARFVNYVAQALEGTHGMIFRRAPVVEVPDGMKDILRNIDREGRTLYQFLSDSVHDIMQTGFGGFLVDLPDAGGAVTVADAEAMGVRPYVTYYPAEKIINWRFKVIDGAKIPVLVVLEEERDSVCDRFGHEAGNVYRVLELGDDRVYRQSVFEKTKADRPGKKEEWTETFIDVTVGGKPLGYIPFFFAPEDTPQKPMMYDLATVNIGHFQKTADYENGVHLTTIPTGWVTGQSPQRDDEDREVPVVLGSDSFLMFPNDKARVGTLVFSGEGLTHAEKALEGAERQMVVLGSRIITTERTQSESAESANIHRAGENAKLATFARNIGERFELVLKTLCQFANLDGAGVTVQMNTDYETMHFDANALNAMTNLFSERKLPLYVLFGMMMKGEFIPDPDMTYEDYVELLDLEDAGLSAGEVIDRYRDYKRTGKRNNLPKVTQFPEIKEDDGGDAA